MCSSGRQLLLTSELDNTNFPLQLPIFLLSLHKHTRFKRKRSVSRLPESNQLPVLYHSTGLKPNNNDSAVGVCVKPLHFNYNKTLELLEFLELNQLLGVSRFTLYNHTVNAEVDCVLRHYISQEKVTLLQWRLNLDSQKEIRTEGLFAALNDCLYRNINSVKYLMLIDFDEVIVPHQNNSLLDMIRDINSRPIYQTGKLVSPSMTAAYSFQNAFFYLQWPDQNTEAYTPPLRTLVKTRRKQKLHPPKQRSKYICLPYLVKEAGNHFVWEFLKGKTVNVPTFIGFLHHYRVCEFGGQCPQINFPVGQT